MNPGGKRHKEKGEPDVREGEALPLAEADPWGEWLETDPLDRLVTDAPEKSIEFDFCAADLVILDELKSRLSILFQTITTFTPEELTKVEELAAKIRKSRKSSEAPAQLKPPERAAEIFAQRADKSEDIVHFIRRLYSPYLDGYYFTIATLRKLDPTAVSAIYRWTQNNAWPDDLQLPTVPEANERLIASGRIEHLRSKLRDHGFLIEDELLELQRLVGARSKKNTPR